VFRIVRRAGTLLGSHRRNVAFLRDEIREIEIAVWLVNRLARAWPES